MTAYFASPRPLIRLKVAPRLPVAVLPSTLIATQAEAIAGTNNTKAMTPLRTADAIKGYEYAVNGSALRNTVERFSDIFNVKDYGAVGDGTADDTAEIQAAFDAAIAAGGGCVYLPKGRYIVSSLITVTCNAQQHIAVRGDGDYISTLDFKTASSLGIYFNSTSTTDNQLPQFTVKAIGLITSKDNCGNALEFKYATANNIDRTCFVDNVFIGQNVDRISDSGTGYGYWSKAIVCTNCRNGTINNLHFFGEIDKATDSSHGIHLLGESTSFVIQNTLILEANRGIEVGGTCEGVYIHNSNLVAVRYGIHHNISSGAEPQLTVTNCHVSAYEVCVWLNNSQQSVIANSLFYANEYFGGTGPWAQWVGVLIQGANSKFNKVVNNTFTKESGRTGDTTIGIWFNGGSDYLESSNMFFGFSGNELTYDVLTTGATEIKLDPNRVTEYVTNVATNNYTVSGALNVTASTASRILSTDGSKNITALDTATYPNLTELSYLKGVDSALQPQIDTLVSPTQWTGRYITSVFTNPASTATLALTANILYAVPFLAQANSTFTTLSIDVTTLAGGSSCRLGIISAGTDGKPGNTVLLDAGVVATDATGIKTTSTFSFPVRTGDFFYFVVVSNGTPTLRGGVPGIQFSHFMGVATLGTQDSQITKAFTYGALSGAVPFGTPTIASANVPIIAFKI
jgi:hypothetical protein